MIYTAAIGGRPNGSMLSHRNLIVMGSVTAGVTGVDHRSVFINSGPLFHIGNFQFDAIATFLFGGTNVYIRRVQEEELLALIAEEHATSAFLMPPTIFKLKELNETANLDISSLRAGPMAPVWAMRCRRTTPLGDHGGRLRPDRSHRAGDIECVRWPRYRELRPPIAIHAGAHRRAGRQRGP